MSDKHTVLIVDDIAENIMVLNETLRGDYKVKIAKNGVKALEIVFSDSPPDIILLDIMMPDMDGYEVAKKIKSNADRCNIPIIFVTAKSEVYDEEEGFRVGAADFITKPISTPLVKARIKSNLEIYDLNRSLDEKVQKRTLQLANTRLQIIQALGRAGEYRDNETGLHVIRMSLYSEEIARAYGFSEFEVDTILQTSPMHDIGKIGTPDSILLKPGRLTDEEMEIMKTHTTIGYDILSDIDSKLLTKAKIIAITHHEKWNGTGYPKGLAGEEIPIEGRIVAVADVFDALTSKRPYKEAWTVERAIDLIESEKGKHFDPEVVEAFMKVIEKIIIIKNEYAEK